MQFWQHDPSLAVPATHFAAGSRPLPFDAAPLRQSLDSTDGISIGGRHAEAAFTADAVGTVVIDAIDALRALHVVGAQPHASLLTSVGLERRILVENADVTERFMVFPDIAAFIGQWSAAASHNITLEWMHQARAASRWNTNASTLLLTRPGESVCIAFANASVEWDVQATTSSLLRVRAHIVAVPDGVLMYATTSRLASAIPAVLSSADDTAARARAFIGTQRRRALEAIALASPDSALDDALAWAVQYLAVPRPFAHRALRHSTHPALHALAACAAGSTSVAREIIAALPEHDPFLPLLLARYHAWTADSVFVATQWERTQAAVAHMIAAAPATPAAMALTAAALSEIAATAGDIGRAVATSDVQSRVKEFRVEHAATLRTTHWVDAVDDAEAASLRSARDVAGGFAARSPAATIADVAYGIFGIEPEAARNRVRFRTHLPATWDAAALRGVGIGDASISLRYSRTFDRDRVVHHFEASQDSGPVPVRLILEPLIDATRVYSAAVDGVSAQLDFQAAGRRVMVPVQLVLDETRVLEVITDLAPA